MKKRAYHYLGIFFLLYCNTVLAAERDTIPKSYWQHSLEANFYIWKDDFLFLPIYAVDKDRLHIEARYNYEDTNTFSGWLGYNFRGGNNFEYTITPMLGGIIGNTNGIAPGFELYFVFHRFEFSSQSEYVFNFQNSQNKFFYNWTEITWSPKDWCWLGMSFQRTRLYETDLDFQYGFLAGGGYKWIGLSTYLFNIHTDDPLFVISLSVDLPEN